MVLPCSSVGLGVSGGCSVLRGIPMGWRKGRKFGGALFGLVWTLSLSVKRLVVEMNLDIVLVPVFINEL